MSSMLTEPMSPGRTTARDLHAQNPRLARLAAPDRDRDASFIGMLTSFRRSGGLDRAHNVSQWLECSRHHKPGTLARWMAHDEVIHFEWAGCTWLPMFQFDIPAMTPRVAVGLVLIELDRAFDNWGMAQWFAMPNSTLQGGSPAEVLGSNPAQVLEAARMERCRVGP